jgi:hypothetical protein
MNSSSNKENVSHEKKILKKCSYCKKMFKKKLMKCPCKLVSYCSKGTFS